MDIYLPAVPAMPDLLGTTPEIVQLTLALYMITLGAGQILEVRRVDVWRVLKNAHFWVYTVAFGTAMGTLFVFFSTAPRIVIERAGFSERGFSLALSTVAFVMKHDGSRSTGWQYVMATDCLYQRYGGIGAMVTCRLRAGSVVRLAANGVSAS